MNSRRRVTVLKAKAAVVNGHLAHHVKIGANEVSVGTAVATEAIARGTTEVIVAETAAVIVVDAAGAVVVVAAADMAAIDGSPTRSQGTGVRSQ